MNADNQFRVACIQMCSGRDVARNIEDAASLVREAVAAGARFVMTPEMTNIIEARREAMLAKTTPEAQDLSAAAFSRLAAELGIYLLAGSIAVRHGAEKLANRSLLFAPDGGILARYDKIHMFDVDLADGESYMESRRYRPGERLAACDLPWGRLGMTICYDLRFPALYRALAHAGCDFIAIPSAFTRPTGAAHWEVLLRARAIETGCFVLAPAQSGVHESGRKTYGHSMIISPWGDIIAESGEEPGILVADIDPGAVKSARSRVPALQHDREFAIGSGESLKAAS